MAGLDGITNKIDPPAPCDRNIYEMTATDRRDLGIASLPGSLKEAYEELAGDEVLRTTLGAHIYEKLTEAKEIEWDSYRMNVHQWEIDEYLTKF